MTPDQAWEVQPGESGHIDDPEVRRIRRVSTYFGGVALARSDWETLDRLEDVEQEALTTDHRAMLKLPALDGHNVYSAEDAQIIADAFPHRKVYFKGELVPAST